MKTLWGREPALILAVIGAVIALVVSFGLNLSNTQQGTITALAVAVLGLITRSQVKPTGEN
jgi:Phr family secreted Rap phosphatase inhibitor